MQQLNGKYCKGLERVAKVVDGVADHDQRLGVKVIGNVKYQQIIDAHRTGKTGDATAMLVSEIKMRSLLHYRIPEGTRIFSYGNTHNNKVQLAYFARKTAWLRSTNIVDLMDCDRQRVSRVGEHFDRELVAQLYDFLSRRRVIGKSLIHQMISYSASYCAMRGSLPPAQPGLKGVVLANDHSPIPVAVSMVCAAAGIKRVYLQHAEVTDIFPPLDFEYALLMNRRSERVYREIGEPSGQVSILRRDNDADRVADPFARVRALHQAERVIVGVYSSSLTDLDRLHDLVSALKASSLVERVFIKPHPSTDYAEFARKHNIDYREQVPAFAHVAIVGNSSVVVELAARGNLVFQDFAMDTVTRDYYGFHEDGLTSEIDPGHLQGHFWRDHAASPDLARAMMAQRDDVDGCLCDNEESVFFKKLSIDLGGVMRPRLPVEEQLHAYLHIFPHAFFASARGDSLRHVFNTRTIVDQLNSLFNQRRLKLEKLYPHVDCHDCRSVVDFWFVLKRVEWSGFSLDAEDVASLCAFVRDFQGEVKAVRWMESCLYDLLLRTCQFDLLRNFLQTARYFRMETAHLNKKMALVNVSRASEENAIGLSGIYDPKTDHLNDFERLKMNVQCMLEVHGELACKNYHQAEAAFLAAAQPSLSREYRILVGSIYQQIAGRDLYIDVKRNANQRMSLLQQISDYLRQGQGLSVLRLSDGEGYLFQNSNEYFTADDARNRERHWWGSELDVEHRQDIVCSGLDAVKTADIIGIPSVYRFIRDHNHKTTSLLTSLQGRGLVAVLQGVLRHASATAVFGDDKLNRAVFNEPRNLVMMAKYARRVVVVSGAREEIIREALECLGEVTVIPVPTHHKTVSNDRFVRSDRPLPYMFKEIRARVRNESGPGTLVLVGAGIAGKSFIRATKEAGGVGVDLGSSFDYLVNAGIQALH